MNLSPRVFLPLVVCLGAAACASKPEPETKAAPKEAPKLVGRIASIPADRRFVLIQSYGKWKVESGSILTTRGPQDRTANLRTTGEALGEFAAADLQSGTVEIGDAVYSQIFAKPAAPTPPAPPLASPAADPATAASAPAGTLQTNITPAAPTPNY